MSLLDAALDYASRGIAVFPLQPGTKIPATRSGVHDATTDAEQIRAWWGLIPDRGVGIACGPSDLLVVDIDVRAGFHDLDDATSRLGLPETFSVVTRSGGWHLYYWQSEGLGNSVDKLAPGVDTRGHGGYVVAPPTPGYEILYSGHVAPLPMTLADRLMRRPSQADRQDRLDPSEILAGVPEGRRNDTLFRYACRLRNQGLTRDEASILLLTAAENCDPPLEGDLSFEIASRVWDTYPAPDSPQNATQGPLRPIRDFTSTPVEWLWHFRIPLGKLTVVAGVQGKGKSYLTAAIAADITRGRPLPGGYPAKGGPLPPSDVIIGAYEDGIGDTLRPRLEALGADLERVQVLGFWRDGSETPRPFRRSDIPLLAASLDENPQTRLLIIDPITSFLGGQVDGNSNEQVRDSLEPLVGLAEKYQIAVVAVAHLNKAELSASIYRISGANAFTALPRSVLMVGQTDAGRRGIAHVKSNLSALADVVEFYINEDGFRWGQRVADLPVKDLLKS